MGYDRDDSFYSDFEPNGFPFGLKSKRKTVTTIISPSIWKEIEYEFSQWRQNHLNERELLEEQLSRRNNEYTYLIWYK